jgi:hypothetical protein
LVTKEASGKMLHHLTVLSGGSLSLENRGRVPILAE